MLGGDLLGTLNLLAGALALFPPTRTLGLESLSGCRTQHPRQLGGHRCSPTRCRAYRLGFLGNSRATHASFRCNNLRGQTVNALNQWGDAFFLVAHQARITRQGLLESLQTFLHQFGATARADTRNALGGENQFL